MEDLVRLSNAESNTWAGRRVFLTGHTGFKGGWLALWLARRGAIVRGYALDPGTSPNLFQEARVGDVIEDVRGDIRDGSRVEAAMKEFVPEVVFHLAAQPLVRLSYADPITTYETNVIGTARVLDAVRRTPSVRWSLLRRISATRTKSGIGDIAKRIRLPAMIRTPALRRVLRSFPRRFGSRTFQWTNTLSTGSESQPPAPVT